MRLVQNRSGMFNAMRTLNFSQQVRTKAHGPARTASRAGGWFGLALDENADRKQRRIFRLRQNAKSEYPPGISWPEDAASYCSDFGVQGL